MNNLGYIADAFDQEDDLHPQLAEELTRIEDTIMKFGRYPYDLFQMGSD